MYVQRIMFYMAYFYKLAAYSQTGSLWRACSIWRFDGIIEIWYVLERFMVYDMKLLIDISFDYGIESML